MGKGVAGDLQGSEIWEFARFLACHFSLALLHIAIDLPHVIREFSYYCSVKLHKMKFNLLDLKVQLCSSGFDMLLVCKVEMCIQCHWST